MSRSSTREKAYKGGEDLEPLRIENNATLEMSVDAKDIREDNYFEFEDKNSKHIVIKGFKAGKWSLNENQSPRHLQHQDRRQDDHLHEVLGAFAGPAPSSE